MSTELFHLTRVSARIDHDGERVPSIRMFKTSPETFGLQLRSFDRTVFSRNAKPRAVYSHTDLHLVDAIALRDALNLAIQELSK